MARCFGVMAGRLAVGLAGFVVGCSGSVTEAGSSSTSSTGGSQAVVSSATSTTSTGSGVNCGGIAGIVCPNNQFCDYTPSTCGADDATGVCRPRPDACPDVYQPTCGCDGEVHSNGCGAEASGVDENHLGNCTPPDATLFACGPRFCPRGDTYCRRTVTDIAGEDDAFACAPVPMGCGSTPTCGCLDAPGCEGGCTDDGAGALTLSCGGG